jgi:predicted Zn-dependent protease
MEAGAALELSECYLQLQQLREFHTMMQGILISSNLPPAYFYRVATLARDAKDIPIMLAALELCTRDVPTNSPPDIFLSLARMYIEGSRADRAVVMMQEYVKRQPADWKAWLDLSYLYLSLNQTNPAVQALLQARNYGGSEAVTIIEQDDRFAPLRGRLMAPSRNLMQLPGVVPGGTPRPSPET